MPDQQIFILGTDWNLWLANSPYGQQIPPYRVPVDGNVNPDVGFQPLAWNSVFVCGSDGNLWLEEGPYGAVPLPNGGFPLNPGTRGQIDGSVAAFWALDAENVFTLGQDGNLWYEFDFGSTSPPVPSPRYPVDGNVLEFQPISVNEVFVLGQDGNLWREWGPFGTVPPPSCAPGQSSQCRTHVASNVASFMVGDSSGVFVVDSNDNLSLVNGNASIPVDGNVADFWAVDAETVYVLGRDGNLWLENAPFGTVPLPPCSGTSGFGKGFGCRSFIHGNVAAFGYYPSAGGIFFIDESLNFWQLGPPPVLIDRNVLAAQPLTALQMDLRAHRGAEARSALRRPAGKSHRARRFPH